MYLEYVWLAYQQGWRFLDFCNSVCTPLKSVLLFTNSVFCIVLGVCSLWFPAKSGLYRISYLPEIWTTCTLSQNPCFSKFQDELPASFKTNSFFLLFRCLAFPEEDSWAEGWVLQSLHHQREVVWSCHHCFQRQWTQIQPVEFCYCGAVWVHQSGECYWDNIRVVFCLLSFFPSFPFFLVFI